MLAWQESKVLDMKNCSEFVRKELVRDFQSIKLRDHLQDLSVRKYAIESRTEVLCSKRFQLGSKFVMN